MQASIDGQTITIRSASAGIGSGGRVTASGTVSTTPGFPANIRIALDDARYTDGNTVVATLDGALTVTGSLGRDPLVAGRIDVERAEIMVPENLGAGAAAIDVRHIDPPPGVVATLRRAKADDGTPVPTARPVVVRLDVSVNAPRRIFVRGRGLDTELGGSVRLTGPVTNIQPVGAFQLIRGRLSILGQRIAFDEGTVTLVGDLDPFLNFVARSGGNDITVFITVTGRVSNPNVVFSSQPTLPQDEVLARLIFNRGINELSPIQIAQLAAAAAELAGGSNTSLLVQSARRHRARRPRRRDRQRGQCSGARRPLHLRQRLSGHRGRRPGLHQGHRQPRHHRKPQGARRRRHQRFQPRHLLREGLLSAPPHVPSRK